MADQRKNLTRTQSFAVYEWMKRAVERGEFKQASCRSAAIEAGKSLGFVVTTGAFYNIARDADFVDHFNAVRLERHPVAPEKELDERFMQETAAAIEEIVRCLDSLATPKLFERVGILKILAGRSQAND